MNKKLSIFISSSVLLVLPVIVFAMDPGEWFSSILNKFLTMILWPIFFCASVLMLIYAGFMFLTAAGDPAKIALGKKAVIWAIVGIIVAILAFSAVGIITSFLH